MSESQRNDELNLDDIKIHSAEVVDKPLQASPYARPAEIIVEAQAWRQMCQHAREDLRNEVGGIMLGNIYEHDGGTVVRVTTTVAARGAINSMASIEFTYDSWSHMEKERQKRAPEEKLIGWYHTHPGFPAFFSSTDRFMHENFFPQPWHVALVINPVNDEHRFYRWDGGSVRECTEFLLQVDQWPGPEPPLNAVLSTALRRAARQLGEPEGGKLGPALTRLVKSLRHGLSSKPLDDLLPFLVACAEFEPDALAEARQRLQEEVAPGSPLRSSELYPITRNSHPSGAISIASGWLVQQMAEPHRLHLHSLEDTAFCRHALLPFPIQDLTIDERGRMLTLTANPERPLHWLEPPLPRLHSVYRQSERRPEVAPSPAEIDWKGCKPPRIGKILAGRQTVYLLTRSEVLVLAESKAEGLPRFELVATHSAADCGWSSFENLTSWATDPTGDLYLLRADTHEVWRLDQIAGRWVSFLNDSDLEEPRSLAVSQSSLSIYDGGSQRCLVQYGTADGRLLCRRPLDEELWKQHVWHLFSDGHRRLYMVTDSHVYET